MVVVGDAELRAAAPIELIEQSTDDEWVGVDGVVGTPADGGGRRVGGGGGGS